MAEIKTEPRKLTDLSPRWAGVHLGQPKRSGLFLTFDCPCGAVECGRVQIALANPVDGGKPWAGDWPTWQRTGEDFATLTLSPSLHMVGHWHGWVQDGIVTSC